MRPIALSVLVLAAAQAGAAHQTIAVRPDGTVPSQINGNLSLSADARFVLFDSSSDELAPGANPSQTVYLRDTLLGTTEVVSVPPPGTTSPAYADAAGLSADGRYAAFVARPLNDQVGVVSGLFLRDRTAGVSQHLCGCDVGLASVRLASGGRQLAFVGYGSAGLPAPGAAAGSFAVYRADADTGAIALVSRGVGGAVATGNAQAISADGRFVLFWSGDPTLDADAPSDGSASRLFLFDATDGSIRWASQFPPGTPELGASWGWLSDDADRVLFGDGTQQRLYVRDLGAGTTRKLIDATLVPDASLWSWSMTRDGRYASFYGSPDPAREEPTGVHRIDLDTLDRTFLVHYTATAIDHRIGEGGDTVLSDTAGITLSTGLVATVALSGTGPTTLAKRQSMQQVITVAHLGGAPTAGAAVDIAVSAGASLTMVAHDMPYDPAVGAGCALVGPNAARCTLNPLTPGVAFHLTLTIEGAAEGNAVTSATLDRNWNDADPSDDRVVLNYTVTSPPAAGGGGGTDLGLLLALALAARRPRRRVA